MARPARRAGGGAPRAALLLGVAGTVVVCHGAASGADVASGIALAAHAASPTVPPSPAMPPNSIPTDNEVCP